MQTSQNRKELLYVGIADIFLLWLIFATLQNNMETFGFIGIYSKSYQHMMLQKLPRIFAKLHFRKENF